MTNFLRMRLFFLLFLLSCSVIAKCPFGSIYSEQYKTCYLVSSMITTWPTAEGVCNVLGGHLVSIHSKAQSDYIISLSINSSVLSYVWLGTYGHRSYWRNTDGTQVVYTAFPAGYPMPDQENHIMMSISDSFAGLWYPEFGGLSYFVCELPLCGPDGSAPASLISTSNTSIPGIAYGNISQSWYLMHQDSNFVRADVAEPLCAKMGAHLPSVRNTFENTELLQIAGKLNIFLGYQQLGGSWSWTDGNTATYTNWGSGAEPRAANNYSDLLSGPHNGVWQSQPNNFKTYVMCEISPSTRAGWC